MLYDMEENILGGLCQSVLVVCLVFCIVYDLSDEEHQCPDEGEERAGVNSCVCVQLLCLVMFRVDP